MADKVSSSIVTPAILGWELGSELINKLGLQSKDPIMRIQIDIPATDLVVLTVTHVLCKDHATVLIDVLKQYNLTPAISKEVT